MAPLTVRNRTRVFVARHRFQRFRSARDLRRETAVRRKLRHREPTEVGLSLIHSSSAAINHRHDVARIGKHRVGKIAVTYLPGPRHVEGIDKNSAAPFFYRSPPRLSRKKPPTTTIFAAATLRLRILHWRHDFSEPSILSEFFEQPSQRRIFQPVVDEYRLVFRRHHLENSMSHFAEHARPEGAVAQAGNDIADTFALL